MATIFDYIEQLKKIYDNKNSFTKGILIDNIDNEINFIKTNNTKLIEDLNKLDLTLIKKNSEKIIFDGKYFKLTIYEYEGNNNDYENVVNLNMINKHYLHYNNNGFNSGIVGTALNLDVSGKSLSEFKKDNNIEDFIKNDKMYSVQITEKFHKTVDFNKLNRKDKINIFIQLLNNINNLYSVYDNLILNLKSFEQIQIYELEKEITYIYNNSKKYKSKYIVKLLDLSTSQIHPRLKNKNVNIKKEEDIKNLINLFNIPEYNNFNDIKSILDDYLKYDFEDTEMTDTPRTYFRNLSDDISSDESKDEKIDIYKKVKPKRSKKVSKKTSKKVSKKTSKKVSKKTSKKVSKKTSKKLTEITGKRLIGGKKNSVKKKKSAKKTVKRSVKNKKKSDNETNFLNDDFSLEDSDTNKSDNDEFLNDDFSLEDSDKKEINNSKSIDDDDFNLDDETSVLLTDNKINVNINDETDNDIINSMSSEFDELQPTNTENNKHSLAKFFNTDPNTIPRNTMPNQNMNYFAPDSDNFSQYSGNSIMSQTQMMQPQTQMMDPNMIPQTQMMQPYPPQMMDPNMIPQTQMMQSYPPQMMQPNPAQMMHYSQDDIVSPTMLKNQMGYNNFNIPPQYAVANQYLNQANQFNLPMNGGDKKKKLK